MLVASANQAEGPGSDVITSLLLQNGKINYLAVRGAIFLLEIITLVFISNAPV